MHFWHWVTVLAGVALAAPAVAALTKRKPGTPTPCSAAETRRRIDAVLAGPRGYYGLGAGGYNPAAALPWGDYQARAGEDPARVKVRRAQRMAWCDCSGFTSWAIGISRHAPGAISGDWISCDAMVRDARGPNAMFKQVAIPEVQLGDVLVYAGRHENGQRVAIGHCCVVIERPDVVARFADLTVAECQAGSSPAVRRHDGSLWDRKNGIAIRLVLS